VVRLGPLLQPFGGAPFTRLIYPMPQHAGLGVHLGFDMAGRCRFGPDARWIDAPDFRFDDSQRARFAAAIRRWWPALRDEELQPDFVGVRPEAGRPRPADRRLRDPGRRVHGIAGLVNLFGIESPGLDLVASRSRRKWRPVSREAVPRVISPREFRNQRAPCCEARRHVESQGVLDG
jgi:L-2-hydroxyglutarate oxidase LhgO